MRQPYTMFGAASISGSMLMALCEPQMGVNRCCRLESLPVRDRDNSSRIYAGFLWWYDAALKVEESSLCLFVSGCEYPPLAISFPYKVPDASNCLHFADASRVTSIRYSTNNSGRYDGRLLLAASYSLAFSASVQDNASRCDNQASHV